MSTVVEVESPASSVKPIVYDFVPSVIGSPERKYTDWLECSNFLLIAARLSGLVVVNLSSGKLITPASDMLTGRVSPLIVMETMSWWIPRGRFDWHKALPGRMNART